MRIRFAIIVIVLCCFATGYVYGLRDGETGSPPLERVVDVDVTDGSAADTLLRLTEGGAARVVADLSPRGNHVTLPKGKRTVRELLSSVAQQIGSRIVFSGTVPDDLWLSWVTKKRVTIGFMFDPYVELEMEAGSPAERLFFRTRVVLPAYNRLVPGSAVESLRPGHVHREKP
jgi:hypothetical protein